MFITHIIVFGILSRMSIKRLQRKEFPVTGNELQRYFNRSSIFAKCFY